MHNGRRIYTDAGCATAVFRPDSQPGDFTLEATSTSVEGSYVSTTGADHYLVVFTAKADVDWTPSDGKIYAQGEVDGDVTVAYYGQDLEFMTEDVVGNTEYTFYAYAAQAFGLDGPKYNTIDPATAKTATMPDAPQCEVAASTATGFTAKLTANSAGDDIVVMVNTYAARISTGDRGYFLAPEGDCTVGYSVPVPDDFEEMPGFGTPENAGTVVYVAKGATKSQSAASTPRRFITLRHTPAMPGGMFHQSGFHHSFHLNTSSLRGELQQLSPLSDGSGMARQPQ